MAADARHVPEFALVTGRTPRRPDRGGGVLLVGAFRTSALVALGAGLYAALSAPPGSRKR